MTNYDIDLSEEYIEIKKVTPALINMIKRGELKQKPDNNYTLNPKFEEQFKFAYHGFTKDTQIKQTIKRLKKEMIQLEKLIKKDKTYTISVGSIMEVPIE